MKKIVRLRLCNCALLVLTGAVLISGVQLEATHSSGAVAVWVHIAVGAAFMALVAWHIYLHFGRSNWFAKFRRQKSPVTRILWWVGLITLVTGIVSAIHWSVNGIHWPVGGVHGKLGFLMIILSAAHIAKRFKFFRQIL